MRSRKTAYIIAALMAFIIYFSGIFTGLYVQENTFRYTEEKVKSLQNRLENIQLEYMYLSTMGQETGCDFLSVLVEKTNNEVWSIGKELVALENENPGDERIEELKKDYSLLSVRAWILNSHINQKCEKESKILLYFYSVPCPDCIAQGNVLDNLRENVYKDKLKVFVLNIDSEEPIVEVLKETHKIKTTPAIVIWNNTYEGLIGEDELKNIIEKSGD